MNNRKLTKSEKREIISLMQNAGFTLSVHDKDTAKLLTGLFFTIPISPADIDKTRSYLFPHHFKPSYGYRNVAVFTSYVTSNIRGEFRRYHSRTTTRDYDTSNIFATFGNNNDSPVENVKIFLGMYKALEYNRS